MKEYLTYAEKSILFAALTREKRVCKELDDKRPTDSGIKRISVVESLENKFYYDKMIKDIRRDVVEEFVSMVTNRIDINEDVILILQKVADDFLTKK